MINILNTIDFYLHFQGIKLNDNILTADSLSLIEQIDRENGVNDSVSYKLGDIYGRYFDEDLFDAHLAEANCLALLRIVVAIKYKFVSRADETARPFNEQIN